jgi:hypothetical protein
MRGLLTRNECQQTTHKNGMRRTQKAKPFETSKDRSVESKRAYNLLCEMLKKFKLVSFVTYVFTGVKTWETGSLDFSRQYFKFPLPGQILYSVQIYPFQDLPLVCKWVFLRFIVSVPAGTTLALIASRAHRYEGYRAIFIFRRNKKTKDKMVYKPITYTDSHLSFPYQ